MAGTLIVSNLTTDTDNTFIVRSNTGTTLFSANTTGIDVANSIGATAITNDKILSVANTKISGNIISSQIAPSVTLTTPIISGNLNLDSAGTTGIRVPTANTISFHTAGTEDVRIDDTGNVGIGTSSPAAKLDVYTNTASGFNYPIFLSANNAASAKRDYVQLGFSVQQSAAGQETGGFDLKALRNNTPVYLANYGGAAGSGTWQFYTDGTERMRIASDGTVRIGVTSDIGGKLSVDCTTGNSFGAYIKSNTSGGAVLGVNAVNPCSTHVQWYNSGTPTGTVTWNGASAVAYNTTSDYRLKENIVPMTGALAKVVQLKPVTYKWKLDGADGQGFIAHELAEVVPDCVSGDKDATREEQYEVTPAVKDEEGNITTPAVMGTRTVPVYQGIDTSFLVATLTAAIQELKAINDTQAETITALTARIVALES